MKLFAISDLHLNHKVNRLALESLPPQLDDWLIIAGDVGEKPDHLEFAIRILQTRFRQLIWVPGNHDLWTLPNDNEGLRGEHRYLQLVSICRKYRVPTPEDPYPIWNGEGLQCTIAPLFLLYDYTFRPNDVSAEKAVDWAMESGILCADEAYLHPDPYKSRSDWCEARCRITAARLAETDPTLPLVLINHFPLRYDVVRLPAIPRFSIWCGTRRTENWHQRFRAAVVVSGHLHVRGTMFRDGVRFEEVSLGYPKQWQPERGLQPYLREILPGPPTAAV